MAVALKTVMAREGVELVAGRLIAAVDGVRKVIGELDAESAGSALLNEHGDAFMEATKPAAKDKKGGKKDAEPEPESDLDLGDLDLE